MQRACLWAQLVAELREEDRELRLEAVVAVVQVGEELAVLEVMEQGVVVAELALMEGQMEGMEGMPVLLALVEVAEEAALEVQGHLLQGMEEQVVMGALGVGAVVEAQRIARLPQVHLD